MSATEKRHSFRNSLFLTAPCKVLGQGVEMTVKLRNISPEGLMAEGPYTPACGAQVELDLRNIGKVEGSVVWVQDNRFGITFAHEIDAERVKHVPPPSEATRPTDVMARRPLTVRLRQIMADPTSIRRI
jgi:hypothetical protein